MHSADAGGHLLFVRDQLCPCVKYELIWVDLRAAPEEEQIGFDDASEDLRAVRCFQLPSLEQVWYAVWLLPERRQGLLERGQVDCDDDAVDWMAVKRCLQLQLSSPRPDPEMRRDVQQAHLDQAALSASLIAAVFLEAHCCSGCLVDQTVLGWVAATSHSGNQPGLLHACNWCSGLHLVEQSPAEHCVYDA